MKIRFPLYLQAIGFLIVQLIVVFVLGFLFFHTQFAGGWDALIASPLGERVEVIGGMIKQQTRSRPIGSWNLILADFGKLYGVKFYVFDRQAHQIAGEPVTLPPPILDRVVRRHILDSLSRTGTNPRTMAEHVMHGRFLIHTHEPDLFWTGMRFPIPPGGGGQIPDGAIMPGMLLASFSNIWACKLFDFGMLAAAVGGMFALSALVWLPFVLSMTRAMSELTQVTERIAEGRFDTRLTVSRSDEIGRLADAVNSMAERLENYVVGQKRFLGDTAHELCSPVSRLRVALELLESSSTAEQEGTIKDIQEDLEEMSSLINELLAFSKASLQGRELQLVPVNLYDLFKNVIDKASCEKLMQLDLSDDLSVMGDRLLLERAFGNIVRNALRYAGDAPIAVKASRAQEEVVVTVDDSGPGVPPEALKLLGQPFFRPEPSRSRDSGGVGLGLAIVKTCVEACGGRFKVRNLQPHGLQVELRLRASLEVPVAAAMISE